MTLRLEEERRRAEETLTLLAAAETEANQSLDEQTAQERETNRQKRLLALAQERLSEEEAVSAEAKRQQQLLNAQVRELRGELSRLQGLLDLAKAEDASAQVRIETLGARPQSSAGAGGPPEQTKRAELEEAERKRLERYQSEFFGQLRDLLGDREGVRIVGDRFVFSSEVLFDSGSADLSDEGRAQIARVAQILSRCCGAIFPTISTGWSVGRRPHRQPAHCQCLDLRQQLGTESGAGAVGGAVHGRGPGLPDAAVGCDGVWRISARCSRGQRRCAGAEPADRAEVD